MARVIHFKKVQHTIIDKIFLEATIMQNFSAADVLLPISGIVFNQKSNVMHIFFPQKISLYEYLHQSGVRIDQEDKKTIAM